LNLPDTHVYMWYPEFRSMYFPETRKIGESKTRSAGKTVRRLLCFRCLYLYRG